MKRFLLNVIAIIAVMAICGKVVAQDPPKQTNMDVKQVAKATIKIDGDGTDAAWKKVDFTKEMYVACGGKNASLPTEADLSVKFKLLWGVDGLYLYEEVKDDVAHLWVTGDTNYLRDNTEMFLYTPAAGADLRTADGAYDQYAVQLRTQNTDAGDVMFGGRINLAWLTDGPSIGTGATKAAFGSLAGGYTLELFVAWADIMLGVKPEDLNTIVYEMGFDIGTADADEADRDVCTQWNNTTESDMQWNNINWFGKLTLKHDMVLPTGVSKIGSEVSAYAKGGNLVIKGYKGSVSAFNALGQEVLRGNATSNETTLKLASKGLIILKLGEKTMKIVAE